MSILRGVRRQAFATQRGNWHFPFSASDLQGEQLEDEDEGHSKNVCSTQGLIHTSCHSVRRNKASSGALGFYDAARWVLIIRFPAYLPWYFIRFTSSKTGCTAPAGASL